MEREPHCRFCKKSLISGKGKPFISGRRINAVPVFGVSRNGTLLVDSDQDSIAASARESFSLFPLHSFPLDQRPVHRLRDTVGSRFNEPLYNDFQMYRGGGRRDYSSEGGGGVGSPKRKALDLDDLTEK